MRINARAGCGRILSRYPRLQNQPARARGLEQAERETVVTSNKTTAAAALALALMLGTGATAFGQGAQDQQHVQQPAQQGMPMQPGMMGQGMGPGITGQGMPMQPGMMGQGMGPGMMGQGMPMQPGMMGQGMGPGMMGQMHGWRVVPMTHLSADDVRHFLEHHLEAHGSERLKVGDVDDVDQGTITAEIVTQEDSLVERLAIDRHTGLISRAG